MGNKTDVLYILEHKRLTESDVCDRYLTRAKLIAENQYTSLRRDISEVIHRQDWQVEQISFITGTRSVNRQELLVTLVTEVSLISRESNLRFERISISRRFL